MALPAGVDTGDEGVPTSAQARPARGLERVQDRELGRGRVADDDHVAAGVVRLPASRARRSRDAVANKQGGPGMSRHYVLAIDQGTTSSRAIVFDREGRNVGSGQKELPQHFPQGRLGRARPGGHLARRRSRSAGRRSRPRASPPTEIAAIGITNQRETTVLWERGTGSAVHRAIVWQDRRTAEHLPPPRRRRARGACARPHRPRRRRLLLRHQARLAARPRAGARAARPSTARWPSARSTASCSGG